MNMEESELKAISSTGIPQTERVEKTRDHVKKVKNYLEKNQFNLGVEAIREFFWHQLCDVWIEEVKSEIKEKKEGDEERVEKLAELLHILKENLKIMHPFVPFVTEAVWRELVDLGLADGLLMSQQIG